MPTPGLTLVGFLDEPEGITWLRNNCVVKDDSDAALAEEWRAARQQLGAPIDRAGQPEILDVPPEGLQHVAQLASEPWVANQLQANLAGLQFKMVELDPLLAFQLSVDVARSDHHNDGVDAGVSLDELLRICLPLDQPIEGVRVNAAPGAMLITSDGLNFHIAAQGVMQRPDGIFIGIQVANSLPLLHVVRFNGRYYLHNGFHRAVGLSKRGVRHAPAIVRDVPDAMAAAIQEPMTFGVDVLESANPPTVAHYATGRAYEVSLKVLTRTMHVSWADHVTTRD